MLLKKINNLLQEYEDKYLTKKDCNILPELLGVKKIIIIIHEGKYLSLTSIKQIEKRLNILITKILKDRK